MRRRTGDKVVQLSSGGGTKIVAVGILYDAAAGNDYCNGMIASIIGGPPSGACVCEQWVADALHADDNRRHPRREGSRQAPSCTAEGLYIMLPDGK